MTYVFFHGIEQQGKSADEIRNLCIDSIRAGLDRGGATNLLPPHSQVVVPFYGDLLARLAPVERDVGKGVSNVRGLNELSGGSDLFGRRTSNDTYEEYLNEINRAQSVSPRPHESLARTRGFTSNALGALSKVLPISAQNYIVNQVLRQVAAYLDDAPLKRSILDAATASMADGAKLADQSRESLIVVGHSLGSVIALEALADFTDRQVDLLMTIGSPLSAETVASRVIPSARRWPEAVRKWVNIADPDDLVALHHSIDRRNFLRNCSDIDHAAIWNILDIKNHMDNHHGIAGYLDDPVVAKLLTERDLWL